MRRAGILILACVVSLATTYFLVEGIYSVARGKESGKSLTRTVYEWAKGRSGPEAGFRESVAVDESQFEELLPALLESGVGLGNTPYFELKVEENQINLQDGDCLRLKPDQHKSMRWLRTMLFEPFNQVVAFYDRDRELAPSVSDFLERYADRAVEVDTNRNGERVTLPRTERDDVVLVAGDSVAFGAGVGNGDTIASQLQRLDQEVEYVNLGVGGARGSDIICNLEDAEERYAGRIRGLVYVYCENDLEADLPYGTPDEVIRWLEGFAKRQEIEAVTVVFAPYIFNVFPEITRVEGTRGWRHPYLPAVKERLQELVDQAGFRWVDIDVLAKEEAARKRSVFGGLGLFVDIVHLSPDGTATVAETILDH